MFYETKMLTQQRRTIQWFWIREEFDSTKIFSEHLTDFNSFFSSWAIIPTLRLPRSRGNAECNGNELQCIPHFQRRLVISNAINLALQVIVI